jgi:glycosyltransferase involved in cell wall biosynthesis
MRLGIQQRVLPEYRQPFFDSLASRVESLEIFAGYPMAAEGIRAGKGLHCAQWKQTKNYYLGGINSYICWQNKLAHWLSHYRPDALVFEANPRLMSNYFAIRRARSLKIPIFGWGLGVLRRMPGQDGYASRWQRTFLRQFDAMIAYSSKGAEDYIHLGYDPRRVFVAPNAAASANSLTGIAKTQISADTVSTWRSEHGVDAGPLLLFVGRLIREKRLPDLLDACARLGNGVQLVIVGDGPERDALKQLAGRIFPRARFLGHLTGESLAVCFSAADLFVLPGSGGLSLQEAMAFGCPVVVASGDGSQWDLVEDGVTGFHLASTEPDSLYRVLNNALQDRSLLQRMGQAAQVKIQKVHNLESMVDAFVAALQIDRN